MTAATTSSSWRSGHPQAGLRNGAGDGAHVNVHGRQVTAGFGPEALRREHGQHERLIGDQEMRFAAECGCEPGYGGLHFSGIGAIGQQKAAELQ